MISEGIWAGVGRGKGETETHSSSQHATAAADISKHAPKATLYRRVQLQEKREDTCSATSLRRCTMAVLVAVAGARFSSDRGGVYAEGARRIQTVQRNENR